MSTTKTFLLSGQISYSSPDNVFNFKLSTNKNNQLEISGFGPNLVERSIKEAVAELAYFLRQSANILINKFKKPYNLDHNLESIEPLVGILHQGKFQLAGSIVYNSDDPTSHDTFNRSSFDIGVSDNQLIIKYCQINFVFEDPKEFASRFIILLREGADLLEEKMK